MKRVIDWLVFAAILTAALFVAAKSVRAGEKLRRVFCVAAQYVRISPTEYVGISNCGDVWKVVTPAPENIDLPKSMGRAEGAEPEAWYFNEQDGTWSRLEAVPALGDTLGYIDVPAED